jgi:two-component system, LuxR family, sensor histidine kinase DctS
MEATARDQAERLQQTARLVTIGEMASLLAHDLNQPLAAISGYAAGLVNHMERGQFENGALSAGDIKGTLDKLGSEAARAGAIIRRVRDFAKRSEPHRLPVDVPALAEATIAALSGELSHAGVETSIATDPGLAKPLGDRVLLEQVLVNLIRNAIEAFSVKPDGQRRIEIALRAATGWVEMRVADNGPGVAPDMRDALFTAFASSKASGMGMGLTICRSILELHGGGIAHEDRPGGGSVFCCRLPVVD